MIRHLQHVAVDIPRAQELRLPRVLRVAGKQEFRFAVGQVGRERKIVLLVRAVIRPLGGGHAKPRLAERPRPFAPGGQNLPLGLGALLQRLHELRVLLALFFVLRQNHPRDGNAFQNLIRAADVILVKMGNNHRVEPLNPFFGKALGQLLAALVRARVDQDARAVLRRNQRRVGLAHIVKRHRHALRPRGAARQRHDAARRQRRDAC